MSAFYAHLVKEFMVASFFYEMENCHAYVLFISGMSYTMLNDTNRFPLKILYIKVYCSESMSSCIIDSILC